MLKKIIITLSLIFTTGCYEFLSPIYYGEQYLVRIESDTYWEGTVDGRRIYGYGNREYLVYAPSCWSVYKTTYNGLLRTFATYRDYYRGGNFPTWDDRATTSPYGSVNGCI